MIQLDIEQEDDRYGWFKKFIVVLIVFLGMPLLIWLITTTFRNYQWGIDFEKKTARSQTILC